MKETGQIGRFVSCLLNVLLGFLIRKEENEKLKVEESEKVKMS
jgi:hypothetical protein